jgi:hypothetical protein
MRLLFKILLFVVVVSVLPAGHASVSLAHGEVGIEIKPTHIAPTIAPGDETTETISLRNVTDEQLNVEAEIVPGADEAGGISIQLEPNQTSVDPGSTVELGLKITALPDSVSGERHAGVLLMAQPTGRHDVNIAGQVNVDLDIKIVVPLQETAFSVPWFVDADSPVSFRMEGRNSGSFPASLMGEVQLSGISGKETLNSESGELAVGETGTIDLQWDKRPAFAIKNVRLTLSSGVGSPVEQERLMIIFPWRLALMGMIIMAVAALGAWTDAYFANDFPQKGRK